MTATVTVPHAGPGTHTVVVALEVDNSVLADPRQWNRVRREVDALLLGALVDGTGGLPRPRRPPAQPDIRRRSPTDLLRRRRKAGTGTVTDECRAAAAAGRNVACIDCGEEPLAGGLRCLVCFKAISHGKPTGLRAEHGTPAAYARHRRAGETPCGPCRDAHSAYNRRHKEAS